MPIRCSTAVSVAVLLCAAGAAMSQPRAGGYRSAFDGYRPFGDQPLASWREANDLVGRIGGWQAYAREGQGAAVGNPGPVPASGMKVPSPAASPASSVDAPSGHPTR